MKIIKYTYLVSYWFSVLGAKGGSGRAVIETSEKIDSLERVNQIEAKICEKKTDWGRCQA